MTWQANLVETQTGRLGAELRITDAGKWDIPLNDTESWDVTTKRGYLRAIEPEWWAPMRASVLMSWRDSEGRLRPWLLGPITNLPEEHRERDTAKFQCKGFGALLEQRILLNRDYGRLDMQSLAESVVTRRGMSLGTIAQEIVALAIDPKLGGQLPVSYGTPREEGSGLNERTYEGFNVANNDLMKLVTALTNVINGPDIMFRPRFTDSSQRFVEWEMVNGTVAQHNIAQTWAMDLDTTSSRSPLSEITPRNDSSALTNRVYWTGAGEDEGTLIRMAQNDGALYAGMPLLETVGSTSDSESVALIQEKADSRLAQGATPLQQLTATIDGSDPRAELGRWHVGDMAKLTLGDDWLTVAPGQRQYKIIAAKGGWKQTVTLEFQEVQL